MPLSALQLSNTVSLTLQKTVAGWPAIVQGPDKVTWNYQALDLTVYTQAYVGILTIPAGTNQTIDLTSFTNLAGETVALTKVLAMVVTVSGPTGVLKITPGTSNGLAAWFFGATDGIVMADGDQLSFARDPAKTPVTVDATHKTIKFANTGAASITVTVVIIGG